MKRLADPLRRGVPCPQNPDHDTDDVYGGPCSTCWEALEMLRHLGEGK